MPRRIGNFLLSQLLLVCLLIMSGAAVRAQYQIKSWTTDDGLPQNTVHSILQTPDGYLWLATLDGLVRYDGVRFAVFNKNNSKGIESNRFTQMVVDRDGALWVGTEESGITRYQDGAFQTFNLAGDLNRAEIRKLNLNEAGKVIVATTNGFVSWNGSSFTADESIGSGDKNSVVLYGKTSGALWSVNGRILHRFKNGQTTEFPLSETEIDVTNLVEDNLGRLWIGTIQGGLLTLENDKLTVYTVKDGLPKGRITPRLADRNGNLWVATDAGAVVFAPDGKISRITTEQGLSDSTLTSIYEDREGNIWIGTLYRGLNRLNRQTVAFYGTKEGLAANIVHPIFQAGDGDVWIGGAGMTRYHNGVFNKVNDGANHFEVVTAIAEDRQGRLWFGHWNGVYYAENGKVTNFADRLGATPAVMDIHEDRAGRLWFATNQGLFRLQNDLIERMTTAEGLPSNDAKVVHESKDGTVWVGTYGGLLKIAACESSIADCQRKTYTTADGLSSNLVRSLYEDAENVLWIGSYDGGLTRLKDGKFTVYTSSDGLFNDGVFQILPDDNGNLWMSSNRGIYRVAKQQLNDFADGRITRIESIAYNKADGLEETECNGGQQPSGTRTADGKLWFPTQRGVAVIDPSQIKVNPYAPPVVLESAMVDDEVFAPSGKIEIAPGKNNLQIAYTGLSFAKPEFVKFRYKLDGLDKDWIEAGDRRTAYYSYLPPGDYTFRVIAANSDGVWNTEGATVKIVVVPPFYRTWWFIPLAIVGAFALVVVFYQQRVGRIERARRTQENFARQLIESQERERSRIAGELHDGLSQSLVIIKNRAVLSLATPDDSERAFEQMEEISSAASEAMFEAKEIIYDLRPIQLDRFGLTKTIKAMLKRVGDAHDIELRTNIDEIDGVLSKEAESNLYRIVQELINNVVRHSRASVADVSIKRTDNFIRLEIADEGIGFSADKTRHDENPKGGFGLLGVVERARLLNGRAEIQSAANGGTTVKIRLPIE